MSVRDEEVKRLLHYAKGLGLKVTFSNKKAPDASADWSTDGSEITIYLRRNASKTAIILSFLHELGHHTDFIHKHNRKQDQILDKALEEADQEEVPKGASWKIYQDEKRATEWWEVICKDANIKISKWKIDLAKEFDVWVYEFAHYQGRFPTFKEQADKRRKLKSKYKK